MTDKQDDPFYIGYLPEAPDQVGRFVKKRVMALLILTAVVAAAFAVSFQRLGPAYFEFGQQRSFKGCLELAPYPHLAVERKGLDSDGENPGVSRYYLTVFGKHGAEQDVRSFAGKKVELSGQLIYRDDQTMIEIQDGSIVSIGERDVRNQACTLRDVTLEGEIIDSKCYLGVMNPGALKPHKACAINCIRGGVPPMLLVRGEDRAYYYLLVDERGMPINDRILDKIAMPVQISGTVEQLDNLRILKTNPLTIHKL